MQRADLQHQRVLPCAPTTVQCPGYLQYHQTVGPTKHTLQILHIAIIFSEIIGATHRTEDTDVGSSRMPSWVGCATDMQDL